LLGDFVGRGSVHASLVSNGGENNFWALGVFSVICRVIQQR
jgi:hypothetical protein